MDDNSIMPFGKYKGKKMGEVPDHYLLWLYENTSSSGSVRDYLNENIDAIKANVKRSHDRHEASKRHGVLMK